jgi:hypothetical protein
LGRESMDYQMDFVRGWAEGPERVISDWEGLIESVRQGLIVGGVLGCRCVEVFCQERE